MRQDINLFKGETAMDELFKTEPEELSENFEPSSDELLVFDCGDADE